MYKRGQPVQVRFPDSSVKSCIALGSEVNNALSVATVEDFQKEEQGGSKAIPIPCLIDINDKTNVFVSYEAKPRKS